ncbi:hypothetical protein [Vibrio cyclitrophicus]|uniref:hypothetical protein n=1 Tax=Vibrio cyclitrophicus TaxID=47951 RepID=UPI0002D6C0CC|nr:hypothetical protein [Vibrio cyclitrophicus]
MAVFDCGSVEGDIEATNRCFETFYKKDPSAELAKKPTVKVTEETETETETETA